MSFQIVVDSCCDLTPQMRRDDRFLPVPLTIHAGGSAFVDDDALDQGDLLFAMRQSETAASTSCPSPQAYLDAFQQGGGDVYVVTLSALLSGSHNSAEQARRLLLEDEPERRVHVFNSCSAASGEVLVALKIRALAAAGAPFEQVVRETERYIYKMQTLFVLETLENLRKNGRLTKLQAVVSGALRIKLFMGSTPEGEICKLGQALSVKQALVKLVDRIAADPDHAGKLAAVCHCNCPERAASVRGMLEEKCRFADILTLEAGGITTVYANDGGIVVAY